MKTAIITMFAVLVHLGCNAANPEKELEAVIKQFTKSTETNDVKTLQELLYKDFRIIFHMSSAEDAAEVDRETYLQKIESKEWGGEKRAFQLNEVIIQENYATAKVSFEGAKSSMLSLMSFIKIEDKWYIFQDATVASFK